MPTKKEKKPHQARNVELSAGIMRYSKSAMYKKRGIWKKKKVGVKPQPKAPAANRTAEKQIGGEKNGKTRKVLQKKGPKYYPTEDQRGKRNARPAKKTKGDKKVTKHSGKLRKSLLPGTVVILLAGRHKGRRVVFLKQLASGLLLVTGPWKVNGVPLRRVNQRYVIATTTKINVSSVKLAESMDDQYFRRIRAKGTKDAGIFDAKKEQYKPSEQRVKDQVEVDKQLLAAIKSEKDGRDLRGYLSSYFQLKNKEYPHKLIF